MILSLMTYLPEARTWPLTSSHICFPPGSRRSGGARDGQTRLIVGAPILVPRLGSLAADAVAREPVNNASSYLEAHHCLPLFSGLTLSSTWPAGCAVQLVL